jgi:hypothetical protein
MTEPPRREKLLLVVKIAAGAAMFQAIFTASMVVALAFGLDVPAFNLFSLLDVIVLSGLASAVPATYTQAFLSRHLKRGEAFLSRLWPSIGFG